jgi:Domain of unknown function (DUF4336)
MISTRTHGVIDYAVAASLGGLSTVRPLGSSVRRLLGVAAAYHASYAVVTDYEAGLVPWVSMRQHLALDTLGAAGFCAAGLLMRQQNPRSRALLLGIGLAELAVIASSRTQPVSGPRQGSGPLGRLLSAGEQTAATYQPTNTPKSVAENVWIVDSGPMHVAGMPLPVRMTIIRLVNGDLLLHSPTQFSLGLKHQLDRLGQIRFLVAPNIAHWTFLKDWQRSCPDATTWAAPGVRQRRQVKKAGVVVHRELTETLPAEWNGQINLVAVPGGGGF